MFAKKIALIGVLLPMMVGLAACKSDTQKPTDSSAGQQTSDGIDAPTTLTFYNISRDSLEQFNDRMGNDIQKKFPNLKINYIARSQNSQVDLASYIQSGGEIDLIWGSLGSWPASVPALDLGYDMSELIKKYNVDLSSFEPTLIDAMRQMSGGDKLFGLPIWNSTNAVIYNKDIFDKFGVSYPKDGMTWDDMYELAKKLTRVENGVPYVGWSPSPNYVTLMNSYSVPLIDPNTKRSTYDTDPRWAKIMNSVLLRFAMDPVYQEAAKTYRKGAITPLSTEQFYKDRVLAMTEAPPSWPVILKDSLKDMRFDFVSMPTFQDLPGVGLQSYPQYMSIANISKNKDAAMKVIKFLISEEYQMKQSRLGTMTSLKKPDIQRALGQDTAFKNLNFQAFFYNKLAPMANDDRVLGGKTAAYGAPDYNSVMNGNMDLNTMLRNAAEKVNQKINTELSR